MHQIFSWLKLEHDILVHILHFFSCLIYINTVVHVSVVLSEMEATMSLIPLAKSHTLRALGCAPVNLLIALMKTLVFFFEWS